MPLGLLREVALFTVTQCGAPDNVLTTLLAPTRYVGPLLTLLMYVAGLRYKELYLLLFGLGLSLDGYANVAWRYVLRDTERPVATCADAYAPFASPSYQAQHTAFFVTFALTYIGLYRPRAKLWHFVLLAAFAVVVFYADRRLNYHSERALLAGAYVGAFNAFVWQVRLRCEKEVRLLILVQLFVRFALYPAFPFVVSTRLARYLAYTDSLCGAPERDPAHVRRLAEFRAAVPRTSSGMVSAVAAERFVASGAW